MPQIRLRYTKVVAANNNNDGSATAIINCDEEDFFDMLDGINPKNIIKYLDMRHIPHRDPPVVNIRKSGSDTTRKVERLVRDLEGYRNYKANN